MKKGELIEILQRFPDDLEIMIYDRGHYITLNDSVTLRPSPYDDKYKSILELKLFRVLGDDHPIYKE